MQDYKKFAWEITENTLLNKKPLTKKEQEDFWLEFDNKQNESC